MKHINSTTSRQGYIRILAAEQSMESTEWLQGTADAIRKNIRHLSADMSVEILS